MRQRLYVELRAVPVYDGDVDGWSVYPTRRWRDHFRTFEVHADFNTAWNQAVEEVQGCFGRYLELYARAA